MIHKDQQELTILWQKYKRTKDLDSRNEIIIHYGYLVKRVVNRLGVKYRDYVENDDLVSYGVLGLIDAIDKFDLSKGVKFETYASLRIRGAIIDQIRQQDWVPRTLRMKAKQIEEGLIKLENQLGRTAKEEELANYLDISVKELQKTMNQLHSLTILSLEDQIIESAKRMDGSSNIEDTPEEYVVVEELKESLAQAIDSLDEKEIKIVSLYYFEQLTLKEIGMVLGVSESRVSQLHTRALMRLRKKLEKFRNASV